MQVITSSTGDCNKASLCGEEWPNMQCHRLVLSTKEIQELWQKEENLESLERISETDGGRDSSKMLCNV